MNPALAAAALGCAAWLPFAAHAQLPPGEYVFEHGRRGVLKIQPGSGGAQKFHLSTVGGNFHVCELEGVIRGSEARMEESAHEKLPCIVTFNAQPKGIAVASKHERACSAYCGVRAHFDGFYIRPPASCEPSRVRRARDQFKAAFDRKQYQDALTLLKPVLDQCDALLSKYDDGWVRNDLALTYHRVGNHNACRQTLLRWVDLARRPDADIKESHPPSDGEEMVRLARATRYNMKLCGAPIAVGGKP